MRNFKGFMLTGAALLALAGCAVEDGGGDVSSVAPPPPPPPPAPVVVAPAADYAVSEGAALSKTTARAARRSGDALVVLPPGGSQQPPPEPGLLTAGDYDDVLNPGLYETYVSRVLQKGNLSPDLPYVDAARRITLRVTDRLGKPVPFADVTVDALALRTGANGTVHLYPVFDDLEAGRDLRVSVDGAAPQQRVLSAADIAGGGSLLVIMDRDVQPVRRLDLLLTLDATGSMSDEMRYLQTELRATLQRVARANEGLDIRAGLIVYRDRGDEYVIRDFPFTDDLPAFEADLAQQRAQGGGDTPEAMHTALRAGEGFDWRPDAVKVNLLVADAPPHDADIAATWDSAKNARARGIHIVPLAASGVDPTAEFLMRAMGQLTGGRYLFLTDDSGIGNPHAEPTVDCYVVTALDGLVQRVLESLVTGIRVEPQGSDVIRTVGSYQAGICAPEVKVP